LLLQYDTIAFAT